MSGDSNSRWARARNILCVRLDNMGDVLMTTPAIRAIKQSGRARRVTLLTSALAAGAARMVPEIDDVIVHDAPWMKSTEAGHLPEADFAMVRNLAARNFDAACIFTLHSQSPLPAAMLCFLAGIPLRIARCRENPYQLLTDWLPEDEAPNPFRHDVERQLALVAHLGWHTDDEHLSLGVTDATRTEAQSLLDELGIRDGDPWCILHPGATAESRRYSADGFGEVARRLIREDRFNVLLTGGANERDLAGYVQAIAANEGAHNLAGKLSLATFAALIERAPLLISNNTGPVHIAAALGTPVVDLYALTNPQHAPWMVEHRLLFHDVPCRNCYRSVCPEGHHHCLALVTPAQVVDAARELTARQLRPLVETGQ